MAEGNYETINLTCNLGIRSMSVNACGCCKTHTLEVCRNFIALGCPINDVLDFGGHFLPLGWCSFFKRGGQQPRLFTTVTTGLPANQDLPVDRSTLRDHAGRFAQ